jgi:hypothetical protein
MEEELEANENRERSWQSSVRQIHAAGDPNGGEKLLEQNK